MPFFWKTHFPEPIALHCLFFFRPVTAQDTNVDGDDPGGVPGGVPGGDPGGDPGGGGGDGVPDDTGGGGDGTSSSYMDAEPFPAANPGDPAATTRPLLSMDTERPNLPLLLSPVTLPC